MTSKHDSIIQGVLCWLWRQLRPRRQGCRV